MRPHECAPCAVSQRSSRSVFQLCSVDAEDMDTPPALRIAQARQACAAIAPRFHSRKIPSTKLETGWEEAAQARAWREDVSGGGFGEEGVSGVTCKPPPAWLTA